MSMLAGQGRSLRFFHMLATVTLRGRAAIGGDDEGRWFRRRASFLFSVTTLNTHARAVPRVLVERLTSAT